MTTVRLPAPVVAYLRDRPWIKPGQLIESLVRNDLGMEPIFRAKTGNQFNIKLTEELQNEIQKQRKNGTYYIRALLIRHIERQLK